MVWAIIEIPVLVSTLSSGEECRQIVRSEIEVVYLPPDLHGAIVGRLDICGILSPKG